MLQVKNLNYTLRNYNKKRKFIIKDISFTLEQGYLLYLSGKNGSGKTTLFRLLYGMMPPDKGSIQWNGREVYEEKESVRREIAYVGEEEMFFEHVAIKENIEQLSLFYPDFRQDIWESCLKYFRFSDSEQKSYAEFSTGQKCQLQLAFALARQPKLLLLDEPTACLDPVFRVEFIELLQRFIAEYEISVIISTHIPEDIEEIADYIGIMQDGELEVFENREGEGL